MKKRFYTIATLLLSIAVLSLTSCLKDDNYVDFSQVGTIVEFPLGGTQNFGADAITAPGPLDTVQFAINISSPSIPTTATAVTVGVNAALVTSYNAANTAVTYLAMPAAAYVFPDQTVTIASGARTAIFTLVVNKSKLDPTQSYMLPIVIKNASGLTISTNMGTHYYHIIGNDFAGTYKWDFTRYNTPTPTPPPNGASFVGATTTILPVTTTQFEMVSGYYTATERYEVSYTETGKYPNATYSNLTVAFNSDDVANIFTPNGISVSSAPVFYNPPAGLNLAGPLTFAQVKSLLTLQYQVYNGSAYRYIIDRFY